MGWQALRLHLILFRRAARCGGATTALTASTPTTAPAQATTSTPATLGFIVANAILILRARRRRCHDRVASIVADVAANIYTHVD